MPAAEEPELTAPDILALVRERHEHHGFRGAPREIDVFGVRCGCGGREVIVLVPAWRAGGELSTPENVSAFGVEARRD